MPIHTLDTLKRSKRKTLKSSGPPKKPAGEGRTKNTIADALQDGDDSGDYIDEYHDGYDSDIMAVDKHELDVDVQELYNQEGQLLRVQGGKVLTDQQIEEEVASSAQWEERKRFKENRFYGMLQEMKADADDAINDPDDPIIPCDADAIKEDEETKFAMLPQTDVGNAAGAFTSGLGNTFERDGETWELDTNKVKFSVPDTRNGKVVWETHEKTVVKQYPDGSFAVRKRKNDEGTGEEFSRPNKKKRQ